MPLFCGLLVTVACSKDEDEAPKSWDTELGAATFATTNTWTISNGEITQVWSDAVQAANCSNKETFNGGDMFGTVPNIDCRSNPNFRGDLFSWRAVNELNLCPDGWRVPTRQDFINLDIALGGNGANREDTLLSAFVANNYITRWGGQAAGGSNHNGTLHFQGTDGHYWSMDGGALNGHSLSFSTFSGTIRPLDFAVRSSGFTLRCIKE